MNDFSSSDLWTSINNDMANKNIDFESFREPLNKLNSRLATWDPYDLKSYRYFKNILFNTSMSMTDEFFELYNKINNTNVGRPLHVFVKDTKVNMEYLFSIMEILFLKASIDKSQSIVEIGGGYGRLCHSILEIFPHIDKYTMIDLPPMITIAKKYLSKVLSEDDFRKIIFIEADKANSVNFSDIFINIDSFAEMTQEVINNYMNIISNKGKYFFCKNTIGKYNPKDIGLVDYIRNDFDNASKTGRCLDQIDIFNDNALRIARQKYLSSYIPGPQWKLIGDEIAYPYEYYHCALYKSNTYD